MLKRTKGLSSYLYVFLIVITSYFILTIPLSGSFYEVINITILNNKRVKLFTILILLLIFLCTLSVIKSFWLSSSIFISISLIISIVNYEKIQLRNEGLLPSDLLMMSSINKILSMISIKLIFLLAIVLLLVFILMYVLFGKKTFDIPIKIRVLIVLLTLVSAYIAINVNKKESMFYEAGEYISKITKNDPVYYDSVGAVRRNGIIINFINNLNVDAMDKPSGYSKDSVMKIVKKYKVHSKHVNKTRINNNQTIIFILSESFSDPNNVVNMNRDPIPFTRSLVKNGIGGNMISDGYGGGTANMEYQSLTGLSLGNFSATLPTPYTQLVVHQKETDSVNDLFDNSTAIHPYYGYMYSRNKVFKKMKFDKFSYLNHGYPKEYSQYIGKNPYVSDKSAYEYLLTTINRNNDGNQFIQLSTMQNHMPFDKEYYNNNQFKVKNDISKNEKKKIENYSMGINYTDNANKFLISKLKSMKRNVTVVFYGDHLPSIYDHVDINKHGVRMHETPYFIWSNHTKLNRIPYENMVGTYSFGSEVMQATNTKITPYYLLIQQVSEKLPIIASKVSNTASDPNLPDGGMNLINRKTRSLMNVSNLSNKQQKLLNEYQIIQYDLTVGNHYIKNSGFMNKIYD